MKLTAHEREVRKSEVKRLRREGRIPVVLYGTDGSNRHLAIEDREFQAHLRQLPQGRLATTVFELTEAADGRVIVKDIQYHPTTYNVLHLDLMQLSDKVTVNVNVPIVYTGVAECVGIRLGGTLRQVIRSLRVNCLPKDIPTHVEVDVRELGIKGAKRLRDIVLPKGVTPKGKMDEVAVVIAKR